MTIDPELSSLLLLCILALIAGFIDAVVGGGGLVQLPALLVLRPDLAIATLMGTNKFASFCGTAVACHRYARAVRLPWRMAAPAALSAFVCSALGAKAVASLDPALVKPVIFFLLLAVGVFTALRRDLGAAHQRKLRGRSEQLVSLAAGAVLGFYDGFFGPGTGTFLIFTFVIVFGCDFLHASASAKVVNLATNAAALLYFAWIGAVQYSLALPMALANIAGSTLGARLAIVKGSAFVRIFFLAIVTALLLRLASDIW